MSRRRIVAILRRLEATWPRPELKVHGSGIAVLVGTILSQNTSNRNSSAAYRQLWRHFRSWKRIVDAPVAEVERHIRVAGLSNIKAPRIQAILRQIRDTRGKLDLQFLSDLAPDAAIEYLQQFNGIGPKTAHCVLLFAFNSPVFPVDTHIHRIARRLGLIPDKASADQAHRLLLPMIPPDDRYALHILLITLGRTTCKAQCPKCRECPLRQLCPSASSVN